MSGLPKSPLDRIIEPTNMCASLRPLPHRSPALLACRGRGRPRGSGRGRGSRGGRIPGSPVGTSPEGAMAGPNDDAAPSPGRGRGRGRGNWGPRPRAADGTVIARRGTRYSCSCPDGCCGCHPSCIVARIKATAVFGNSLGPKGPS